MANIIKVGINGFGPIGRQVLRAIREYYPNHMGSILVKVVTWYDNE